MEQAIRDALRQYEREQGISLRSHARRLGISAPSLSAFLRGDAGLGVTMARAIRATHEDIVPLLRAWVMGARAE